MKHLGDITKIDWFSVEPVDVVTGGSPCQDLSVAGKRAGLAGERSGLFMEQIRCVKELRKADELRGRTGQFIRPRYMVWENVPGAFSSGNPKGADFGAVLEEIAKVCEPEAPSVPVPEKGWPHAGCLYDDMGRWSIAWRVHDAQFWGVPQRRKRIALVADFGGLSAPEVLFELNGLSGNFEQSGAQREGAAGGAENGTTTYCLQGNGIDLADTAGCNGKGWCEDVSYTLNTIDRPAVYDARGNGDGDISCTITVDHENRVTDYTALCVGNGQMQNITMKETANTLSTLNNQSVFNIGSYHSNAWKSDNPHSGVYETDVSKTLDALNCGAPTCNQGGTCVVAGVYCRNGYENTELSGTIQAKENGGQSLNYINPVRLENTVRRLTPLECERLQGYPDGWTDIGEWVDSKGKKHKEADSPRYKALGNSIALPFWKYLLKRISAQYERDATLGSLFDGIGGFPLCWEQINGKGSARWASEIEEFPMAVTKIRFGEE